MDLLIYLLYFIALISAFLGVLVLMRNAKGKTHQLFFVLSISVAAWTTSNAMFAQAPTHYIAYKVALLSYAFAALVATLFLFFAADLSEITLKNRKIIKIIATIFIVASAAPGCLATNVIDQEIITTPFIVIYAIGVTSLFGSGIILLFNGLKTTRGQRRQQIGAVILGLLVAITGGVFFNLALPLQGNYNFVLLGPAFSVFFIISSVYAIFRHRLFDLRSALVRFFAYCLALLTILILYAVIIYAIVLPMFGDWLGDEIVYVYPVVTVIVVIIFQPTKRLFRKITQAIFFRNSYNTEKILDKLGKIIVTETNIASLLRKSQSLLCSAIKPSSTEIILIRDNGKIYSAYHNKKINNAEALIGNIRHESKTIIVTDYLSEHGGDLYHNLIHSGIAVVAPLVTPNAKLGYLLIGYKASGDAFTDQDVELIGILTDELAVAIQNTLRYEEIARFNVTLKKEVKNATSQLTESNHKLQRLDEVKNEFISMASHQLRTPLTGVKGYISMVLDGDAGEITSDQRRLLEEAFSSAQRMVYLIGDFLNISRLQTGKFVLEKTPVNLANIISDEIDQLQSAAAMRDIKLIYHRPAGFPEILIDDGKIRQVIMNFIDNAIFYSKPDDKVLVELSTNGKDVVLQVQDDGIGVPKEEQHKIFTKFFRATNARKVRPDGTGIGLYMAKKVITAHGGSIIFQTKEGKGSTFGFRLPLKD